MEESTKTETPNLSVRLCRKCVERSTEQGFKGVKRDQMALEFFCGVATALEESNFAVTAPEEWAALTRLLWLISIRGYIIVKELAAE